MLLSEPTSCKSVFKSSILLFVSSWRLKMLIVLVTIDVVSVFDGEETDFSICLISYILIKIVSKIAQNAVFASLSPHVLVKNEGHI